MHRDHVPSDQTPEGFEILGSTSLSENQGMVRFHSGSSPNILDRIHIFTVQGHPEFTEPIVTSLVEARSESGVIDAAAAEDFQRRRLGLNDGIDVIGPVVWGILGVVPVKE